MAEKVETEVSMENVGANDFTLSEMEELLIKTYCFSIQYNASLALGLIKNNV